MRSRWRLRDAMGLIAIIAIYLAAFRVLGQGPGHDPATMYFQMLSAFFLFILTPFLAQAAWDRFIGRED